jgi:hypothetical protein
MIYLFILQFFSVFQKKKNLGENLAFLVVYTLKGKKNSEKKLENFDKLSKPQN